MILYLENTGYQEFDAWLCNKAGKYGFMVSYDETGLVDIGDVEWIPKAMYPLRIYLSGIHESGISYGPDAVFIIEKVGSRLKVCPKVFSSWGKTRLQPVLIEIAADWPDTKVSEKEELGIEYSETNDECPRGRKPNLGYDEAFRYMIDEGCSEDTAFGFWKKYFPEEAAIHPYQEARSAFRKAMKRRSEKAETHN